MTTTTANMKTGTDPIPVTLRITPNDGVGVSESIRSALGKSLGGEVLLDLRNIRRITSHELSALIGLTLRLRSRRQRLVLTNVHSTVADVFKITRFDRLIETR